VRARFAQARRAEQLPVEEELAFRLAAVAAARAADRGRIRALAARANLEVLVEHLAGQRLLALIGSRLIDSCEDLVEPALRRAVAAATAHARLVHVLGVHHTVDLCRRLEQAGIEVVALKGPLLAERIYADPALRAAPRDIDLLVRPERLDEAVQVVRARGFALRDDDIWADGLPHYHYGLLPQRSGMPNVELHWRLHWYEREFAQRLISRSLIGPDGVRIPSPADDLAALLIVFARDGFVGLRLAADIGAWWDANGARLRRPGLEGILAENPRLRATLLAAVEAAEALVAVPRHELVSERWRTPRRARVALRLVNWRGRGDWHELTTDITLIDLLLIPLAAGRVFIRHYYFQPLSKYAREHGWRPEARFRNELRRTAHALVRLVRSAWRYGARLWSIRRGGETLPARPAQS